MEGPADARERVDALCASMRRLATYSPECVLVLTGPAVDAGSRDVVISGLQEVARAAATAGVRLGLEPSHPRQHGSVSFVNGIADALALLDEAGLDDVGLMADTYNLWHEPPQALAAVADRVTGLHVADEPAEPGRTDRALPGEGGARSAEHVAALRDGGLGGLPRRRDLLDPGRLLGALARRGRPPRVRGCVATVSFDLYAWKRPLPSSEDDALALVKGDESAFEPSADLLRFYDDLLERYPVLEWDGIEELDDAQSTWGVTAERSDRLVGLNFTWSAPGEVLDDVVALALEHELVLYDPQGPSFHSPAELLVEPIRRDPAVLRQALVGTSSARPCSASGSCSPFRCSTGSSSSSGRSS